MIEVRMSTRVKKNIIGPEDHKHIFVVFLDDLNMPKYEKFGAQPCLELVR
jgi:hypothetical protein